MDRVYAAGSMSVSEVGLAIKQIDETQRHIGLLYKDSARGGIVLLHLAFHLDLRLGTPTKDGLWVDPAFPEPRLRQVAAICRRVWNQNKSRIPFGLSRPNDCFDHETYAFLIGPTRHGLTCATFVLALFLQAGLEIVDYDSWPSRADDTTWQQKIIEPLRERGADSRHIEAVQENTGAVRVRPEEVAGAATLTPHPSDYRRTRLAASEILRLLLR